MPLECNEQSISSMKYSISESKVCYPSLQKLLYTILITSRKLYHYFDEYKISVVTDFPLADILYNRDTTGSISKWEVDLGALEIDFNPRIAIKSQALVNFLVEWREQSSCSSSQHARALGYVLRWFT